MYCRMQNDKKKMRHMRTNKICLSSLDSVEHLDQPPFFQAFLDRVHCSFSTTQSNHFESTLCRIRVDDDRKQRGKLEVYLLLP